MCVKYFDGDLAGSPGDRPPPGSPGSTSPALVAELKALIGTFQYNVALQRITGEVIGAGARYIDATKPFTLAKTDPGATRVVMANLAESLRVLAILIKPFLPRDGRHVLPRVQLRG